MLETGEEEGARKRRGRNREGMRRRGVLWQGWRTGRTGGRCLPSHTPTRSSRVSTPQPPPPRCRHTLTPPYGAHPCDVTRASLTPASRSALPRRPPRRKHLTRHVNLTCRFLSIAYPISLLFLSFPRVTWYPSFHLTRHMNLFCRYLSSASLLLLSLPHFTCHHFLH